MMRKLAVTGRQEKSPYAHYLDVIGSQRPHRLDLDFFSSLLEAGKIRNAPFPMPAIITAFYDYHRHQFVSRIKE